jgi:hypothetical protein
MTLDGADRVMVTVDQQVRDLSGNVLTAGAVTHAYTLRDGLVARFDIVESASDGSG